MRRAVREPPRAAPGRPGDGALVPGTAPDAGPARPPPLSNGLPPLPPPAQAPTAAARSAKNMGVSSLKRGASAVTVLDASNCLEGVRAPYTPHPPLTPRPPHLQHPHLQHQHQAQQHQAQHHAELQRLRAQVEERDKEIAALRQAARVKDRKLDQLANKCRKEQMRQYYRFMELEPVVELEEDACEETSSSSSSGPPSLSPPPFGSDGYWSEDSAYAGLAREHAELQRSHHALELRLKRSEARARAAAERLQQLQAEAQELRELAELQEFRILELEGAGEHTTSARSPAPDTRDVCTDMENDDVSDSGVLSLAASEDVASDSDLGVHDLKLELPVPAPSACQELKDKVLAVARSLVNVEDKWTLHQVAALLEDARPVSSASSSSNMTHVLKSLPDYALNGYSSKFPARIVATVPPFNEMLQPMSPLKMPLDLKAKPLNGSILKPNKIVSTLAANFCLRCTEELCTQGTQTELNNNTNGNANTNGVGASVPNHGDLRAEIQKLNQFRERVEERGGDLAFCRERLSALEDKIRLYERNGDAQQSLLSEKAAREAQLTAQVQTLTTKLAQLQADKTRLDEQRCDLEEAENDLRRRCNKLEMKLQLISGEKCDLQSKLLQERRTNANLKSSLQDLESLQNEVSHLQTMLNSYEERNYELEERETELRHQLELLVQWCPVAVVWNAYRAACAVQSRLPLPLEYKGGSPLRNGKCNGLCASAQERLVQRMRELEQELQQRLAGQGLHKTDRETMTEALSPEPTPSSSPSRWRSRASAAASAAAPAEHECCAHLRGRLHDLEQKERAYREMLQEADDVWANLEGGYQRQLQELQESEAELRARLDAAEHERRQQRSNEHEVCELEQSVCEAAAARRRAEEEAAAARTRAAALAEALAAADATVERLQLEAERELRPQLARERRLNADLQREMQAKAEAAEMLHEQLDKEIEKLTSQISRLEKEKLQLNNEIEELKVGMEKLQNILKQQEEHIVEEREQSEKALANISNMLAKKEWELQCVISLTRDEDVKSIQEEFEDVGASSYKPSQIHKSNDIESENESSSPQYSTFPRSSREKTLLPPIKPPRRVKKTETRRSKDVMTNKACSLESISNTQVNVEVGFKGRNRSIQDISAEGMTSSFVMISPERNERAPTPIPNSKRETNSTNKGYMNYISTGDVNKCQTPEILNKPSVRGWRSQPESLRKPRWLTELSVRVNESSRTRPMSFPIKRSILYWDNINPKLQLKFSS